MILFLLVAQAHAFCGTFVGGDGALLTNSASQVVLAREGTRTTMTLVMDYQGDLSEFALLLPVPEVLDAADVTSPDGRLLTDIDTYSMPREVAYACSDIVSKEFTSLGCGGLLGGCSSPAAEFYRDSGDLGESSADTVSIESAFTVAGYEFVVLSAEESAGLEAWLDDNGYALPAGGQAILQEYIDAGSYFLAAKVTLTDPNPNVRQWLPPIQLRYESESWSLPIRIGTISASGTQEVIVYALDALEEGEVGIANFPQVSVEDECMRPDSADLATYYGDQMEEAFAGEAGWMVEFSWELQTVDSTGGYHCDPCTTVIGIPAADLQALGLDSYPAHLTRMRVRYAPEEATQDLVLFASGITGVADQIRYIQSNPSLEDQYAVCGKGFVDNPGTCLDPDRDPILGLGAFAPVGALGVLGVVAMLRRRRSA